MSIDLTPPTYHQGKIFPLTACFGDAARGTLAYYQVVGLQQAKDGGTRVYYHGDNTYHGYQKACANDVMTMTVPAGIQAVFGVLMTAYKAGVLPDLTDSALAGMASAPKAPEAPTIPIRPQRSY